MRVYVCVWMYVKLSVYLTFHLSGYLSIYKLKFDKTKTIWYTNTHTYTTHIKIYIMIYTEVGKTSIKQFMCTLHYYFPFYKFDSACCFCYYWFSIPSKKKMFGKESSIKLIWFDSTLWTLRLLLIGSLLCKNVDMVIGILLSKDVDMGLLLKSA